MAPNSSAAANSGSRAQRRHDVTGTFAHALDCHRRGLLAEAQKGYRLVLKKRPNHFDTLHMLGVSEKQLGNEAFIAKAPQNVVDGLKKQQAEMKLLYDKTKAALDAL